MKQIIKQTDRVKVRKQENLEYKQRMEVFVARKLSYYNSN